MTHDDSRLDTGVAERHSFGVSYERPKGLEKRLEDYRGGVLRLPPHPEWRGEFTDWVADPFGDRNWQFQHHTLRWLNPLRWAARDGDNGARMEWLRVAKSWLENNIPSSRARSVFAWKDMADGNRAIQLSLGSPFVSDGDDWYLELLKYHRDWLMDPSHIVGKNHGLHQHTGLLVVGATLRDAEAIDTAVSRMESQFLTTFDPQGGNDEGSTGYHQLNLKWWKQAWVRAELEGCSIPSMVSERLEHGSLALAHLALPDGQMPQIGDTARGSVSAGIHPYIDFVASGGTKGAKPDANVLVLDVGYVASRSGWGEERPMAQESHMLLRHGPDVRAHSHADRGSLHIFAGGLRWLVDAGFHSYQHKDATREHLHSREAHNIAFIPGRKYDHRATVDLVRQTVTSEVHDFSLVDNGYNGSDVVCRRVVYLVGPDAWLVIDSAETSDAVKLVQHWQVEVGVEAWYRDRGFRLRHGTESLTMTWLGAAPRLRRHDAVDGDLTAWIGTRWKTLQPGIRIIAESTKAAPRLVTLVAPNRPSMLGVVDSRVSTAGSVSLTVVRGGRTWSVRVDDEVIVREV